MAGQGGLDNETDNKPPQSDIHDCSSAWKANNAHLYCNNTHALF